MSTESLNRTSNIEIPEKKQRVIRMSPRKVNIDVLKKRVITEKKKEALQSKIIIPVSYTHLTLPTKQPV